MSLGGSAVTLLYGLVALGQIELRRTVGYSHLGAFLAGEGEAAA